MLHFAMDDSRHWSDARLRRKVAMVAGWTQLAVDLDTLTGIPPGSGARKRRMPAPAFATDLNAIDLNAIVELCAMGLTLQAQGNPVIGWTCWIRGCEGKDIRPARAVCVAWIKYMQGETGQ